MSAFMVAREHIDLLVGVAIEGPRGIPVAPDSPAVTGFPVRWHTKLWHEVDDLAEFDRGHRRLLRPGTSPSDDRDRTPSQLGQLLLDANLESIQARYPETASGSEREPYEWSRQPYRLTAVEGLNAIACLDYQSCEYRGWRISAARRFLDALERPLIRCLPGYSEAS